MADEFDIRRDKHDLPDDARGMRSGQSPDETGIPSFDIEETIEQFSRKAYPSARRAYDRDDDLDDPRPRPQRRNGDNDLHGKPVNMYSRPERRGDNPNGGQRRSQGERQHPHNGQGQPRRRTDGESGRQGRERDGAERARRGHYDQYDQYSRSSSRSRQNAHRDAARRRADEDVHDRRGEQNGGRRGAGTAARERQRKKRSIKGPIIGGIIIVILALGIYIGQGNMKIDITVNGKQLEVAARTTYEKLHEEGFITDDPGDFVAVDGSVIEAGQGEAVTVLDDGEVVTKLKKRVHDGSVITQKRGADIEEESTTSEGPEEASVIIDGGAGNFNFYNRFLHVKAQDGKDGVAVFKTGAISGKTAIDHWTDPMKNEIWTSIDSEKENEQEKVIALTFDDGPHPEYTDQVLAVLDQYDAKATFFLLGKNVEQYPEIAKRVADSGNQVASHTYSHEAENYLNRLDADGVKRQLSKAQEAIENASGVKVMCVRPPGGNIDGDAILACGEYADSIVGWSIDSQDWQLPGADTIVEEVESAAMSGSIILMHDGGGDRSETVEAIKQIIPDLQAKGYRFVTIDELIELRRAELDEAVKAIEKELGITSSDDVEDEG